MAVEVQFTDTDLSPVRKVIGKRMEVGWAVPKVSITVEVVTEEVSARLAAARTADDDAQKTTLFDAILFATARSLERFPVLNSMLVGEKIRAFADVNLGFAVNLPQGLFVPVIRNANRLNVREIAAARAALTVRIRAGDFSSKVLGNGTFTVSNLGSFGTDFFSPIINAPQCAILGVGAEKQRPVVVDGRVIARRTTYLTLVFDHRIVDGAPAADFLRDVAAQVSTSSNEMGV